MKKSTKIIMIMISVLMLLSITVLIILEQEDENIATSSRVYLETGLSLPEGTKIVATASDTFSLADGSNYEWLIESNTSLSKWIESSSMNREDGDGISWVTVKNFGEIANIARDQDRELMLDSVWRSVIGEDTAYIYVASERYVALIRTFRP